MGVISRFKKWREKRAGPVVKKIGNYSIHKRKRKGFTYGMGGLRMVKFNREGFTEFNVMDKKGKIVGRSAISNEGKQKGMPLGLAVLPKHRKKGLGKAQVGEILKELKSRGIKKVSVPIGPGKWKAMNLSDNAKKAQNFYKRIAEQAGQKIKFTKKNGKVYLEYDIK